MLIKYRRPKNLQVYRYQVNQKLKYQIRKPWANTPGLRYWVSNWEFRKLKIEEAIYYP